jgi:hypothetical protein
MMAAKKQYAEEQLADLAQVITIQPTFSAAPAPRCPITRRLIALGDWQQD